MFDPSENSYKTHLYFPNTFDDHQDSDVCSPPLWRTSPSTSPRQRNSYGSLSPASKAQAIARGQRELMEMVSKMPESCYELSLKDLVEVNATELDDRKVFDELPKETNKPNRVVKSMNGDKWAEKNRDGSMNNSGFLLKMMFPVNLGSKKRSKKKKDDDSSVRSKGSWVSPRPSISDRFVRTGYKNWWKKEFSESQGSESGISSISSRGSTKSSGSSRSSSSSSNRSRSNSLRDHSSSCLSFLWNLHRRE